ncbi:MAG TPA: glycosyl hydrolase [Lacipirellula sp.]
MATTTPQTRLFAPIVAAVVILTCVSVRGEILSSKRGFADVGASYSNLQAAGAGWYYTWGPGDANPGNFDANHIPMIWGGTPSQSLLSDIRNRPGVEWLLGFNEPERPDQANMTVSQAISSWTTIANGLAGSGIKLISPSVADTGGANGGQAWLADFMNRANSARLPVDAVAFHWYGVSTPNDPAGAASSFLSRVASYHNQYNKPVFITEFAIHDWGGNYSDAEITEANRQFLDFVIPELESRDYVAGYAWYHWFSDARLYSGNPPTPTPMGHSYVGALENGQVENVAGRDLGEHVAYLAGGELTMSGGAPGTVRYINALAGASSLSGNVDWTLTPGHWMRIQPGATLRKTGGNELLVTGSLTNNGVLEVAEGTLRIGAGVAGAGDVVVRGGGTLSLTARGGVTSARMIDVRRNGTFDAALSSPLGVTSGQTLQVAEGGQVMGDVLALSGSTLTGGGQIGGNLTVQSGAVVRIGDNGAGAPRRIVIDNFNGYASGDVRNVASPPWTAHQNTSLADIESYGGSQVLSYGWTSDFRGVSRSLPDATVLDDSEQATYFFRFNSKTDAPNHNIGLGDQASTSAVNFDDFEPQLRLKPGPGGTFALDARNGGGFTATLASGLALNTWYNVWMVVDQQADAYDVYMNTGTAAATAAQKLNASPLAFRQGTAQDLDAILALAGGAPVDNGVRIDDIVYQSGIDLTNPTARFVPDVVWTPETWSIAGDYSQSAGATLEINLLSPSAHDVLAVGGHAGFGGTLRVTLAAGGVGPQAGDVFDILDFGSASGDFDEMLLPSLPSGLAWSTSQLLSSGTLAVVSSLAGDFNSDGNVDGADFLAWQRGDTPDAGSAAELADWRSNFGSRRSTVEATVVPEPAALLLAIAWLPGLYRRRSWMAGALPPRWGLWQ